MRNFLKSGAYTILAPIGAEVTLQYNVEGNLEKIYKGYRPDLVDVTEDVIDRIIESHLVPQHIPVTGGTSWVTGVLYTNTLPQRSGLLTDIAKDHAWAAFKTSTALVNFFAALIDNTTVPFNNPRAMHQTLQTAGFNMLPVAIVPAVIDDNITEQWVNAGTWTYATPLIYHYFMFCNNELSIHYERFYVFTVASIDIYTQLNGELTCKLIDTVGRIMYMPYANAAAKNIQLNTVIVIDEGFEPVFFYHYYETNVQPWQLTRTCEWCGKVFHVPTSGATMCDDPHCPSKLYPRIELFLNQLQLTNAYTEDEWIHMLRRKELLCLPDIFLLKPYETAEVTVTLRQLLRALIPIQLLPNDEVISLFVNKCLNNPSTVLYYAEHADRIQSDLDLHHKDLLRLTCWLSDDGNVSDLNTLVNLSNIDLTGVDKSFEGAPIFRNKTIMLTGDFIHGDFSVVSAILRSYAANVVSRFNNNVDCVLVGDKGSNIDGQAVQLARSLHKSVQTELNFFAAYEIDEDLKTNLV